MKQNWFYKKHEEKKSKAELTASILEKENYLENVHAILHCLVKKLFFFNYLFYVFDRTRKMVVGQEFIDMELEGKVSEQEV